MQTLKVNDIPEGKTLKSYIGDVYPKLKPSILAKAMAGGDVKLNGERQRKNVPISQGDEIHVYLNDEELGVMPSLEFVYEDDNLMIVNKQPGISSFDDKNNGAPNILDMAEAYMREKGEYKPELMNTPFLCHRLDHYTGGLMVVAKHEHAYKFLLEAFQERRIRKFYQAILCGQLEPPAAQLHDFLIKDANAAKVRIEKKQVKNSIPVVTRYKTLSANDDLSRVEIELVTGRTHQIRAHMAFYKHPVLGDDKYGNRRMNKKYGADYQVLWANKLIFEVGAGNFLEYLNKQVFETKNIVFPESVKDV
jgi:23S rRNA pseudouridine955/2504/2580 synthase